MASQVFSGNGNFSYTNSTGKNVRVIINFMQSSNISPNYGGITVTWAGVTVSALNAHSIGRNLAGVNAIRIERQNWSNTGNMTSSYRNVTDIGNKGYGYAALNGANLVAVEGAEAQQQNMALPTEIMLAPNQSFSAVCGPYNIVIIKEDGS
jgi:hypothetical protein